MAEVKQTLQAPESLTPGGMRVWNEIVPTISGTNSLRMIDIPTLQILCENENMRRQIVAHIDSDGVVVDGKPHKLMTTLGTIERRIFVICDRYGMNPYYRRKLPGDDQQEQTETDDPSESLDKLVLRKLG